jgi:hypothetical protein
MLALYKVSYTYYTLIDGAYYDSTETQSSDYWLILGTQSQAYDQAGDTSQASSTFIGNGFQWATSGSYFENNFEKHIPDRWYD